MSDIRDVSFVRPRVSVTTLNQNEESSFRRRPQEVGVRVGRHHSGDKEYLNQVWKKICDASEKEIGEVPRELKIRWEHHTGNTAQEVVEEEAEESEDESFGSDEDEDDEDLEDKEPKSVEELKVRASPLAAKIVRKKDLIRLSNQQGERQRQLSGVENVAMKAVGVRDSDWYSSTQNTRKRLINSSLWRIQVHPLILSKTQKAEFGSTVVSFFEFLRWTAVLNIFNAFFLLMLIIVPQLVQDKKGESETFQNCDSVVDNNITYFPVNETVSCCSQEYRNQTKQKEFYFNTTTFFESLENLLVSLLQGTNWMEASPMFYGYYEGTYFFDFNGYSFNFPLAFFLVMLCIMVVNLIVIVVSSAKSLYKSIGEVTSQATPLSSIVFTRWDFGITKPKGIKIQQSDILTNLKVVLASGTRVQTTRKVWAIRFFVNVFVFGTLAAFLAAIYFVTTKVPELQQDNDCSSETKNEFRCFVIEYLPSITVTGGNIIIPFMFTMLISLEKYSNKNSELFLNLSRCISLRLASLLVTLLSMKETVTCGNETKCFSNQRQIGCNQNETEYAACFIEDGECRKPICWETYVGQQFYQLTVVDFLAQVGLVFIVDFPRSLLLGKMLEGNTNFRALHENFGRIEFNISKHVLDIVYTQAICWLALFYAPLISVVTVFKCIAIYLLRIFYVLYVCVPSQVAFSASRASAFFKGFLLLSFGLTVICVGLFIGVVVPSSSCGPFKNVTDSFVPEDRLVYNYVINTIEDSDIGFLESVLFFLGKTSVQFSIAGVLALLTYFLWAYSSADRALLQEMRKQLKTLKSDNGDKFRRLRENIKNSFP